MKLLYSTILLFLFYSCSSESIMDSPEEDLVLFNQTQPVDGKIIREFPKNSLGFYSRIGDSSSLIEIEPYIITSQSIFKSELNIPKEQTDSLSDFHNWSHDSIILHLNLMLIISVTMATLFSSIYYFLIRLLI